jgi:uncharacterized OsmC-like protein
MNREQLRELQRPWKEQFRRDPASALVELRATGTLHPPELVCQLRSRPGGPRAGLHRLTGGDGAKTCAAELMLDSLVACAGVTLLAVATSMEIPVHAGDIEAVGRLDFRGTLGVDREARVGFSAIRLSVRLNATVDDEQLEQLLKLTERYCVVYQTLRASTPMASDIERQACEDSHIRD